MIAIITLMMTEFYEIVIMATHRYQPTAERWHKSGIEAVCAEGKNKPF